MPRLKQTALAYLSATLIVVAGCQLSAFEQGTYFIYQLIEQSDTPIIAKRLAVDSKLFVEPEKAPVKSTTKVAERSEFEMNYNSLGTTSSSGFDSTPATSTEEQITSDTSAFNVGTQDDFSFFGN